MDLTPYYDIVNGELTDFAASSFPVASVDVY